MKNNISVNLNLDEWNYVLSVISKQPINEAVKLFFSIRSQVEQQAINQKPDREPFTDAETRSVPFP